MGIIHITLRAQNGEEEIDVYRSNIAIAHWNYQHKYEVDSDN